MLSTLTHPRFIFWSIVAAPFAVFAACIAWLVVPIVVTEVVPAAVRAVTNSN